MDGRALDCDGCGARLGRATAICPHCATPFPGGLKGLDSYLKAEHQNLRLAGLVVMWTWMATAFAAAVAFTSIFIVRLA